MNCQVSGERLVGHTSIIASKSVVHRLLIAAALCNAPTVIRGVTFSEDVLATIACIRAALAEVVCEGNSVTVKPYAEKVKNALLDCGESGSTLRFLLPVMAALGGARFTGRGRLAQRPLTPLATVFERHGCTLSPEGMFPLTVSGQLSGCTFEIDGSVSSQFISGLLMAAPLIGTPCTVRVTGELTSLPYIQITMSTLSQFGITVEQHENCFTVCGAYRSPGALATEGDWSNAAFWLVGAALSDSTEYTLGGVSAASLQGDRRIVDLLNEAGFSVLQTNRGWAVRQGEVRRALSVNAADIPDLVPIVAVLATALEGETVIHHAARLIHKESNRLESVCAMIHALGGRSSVTADGLRVVGTPLRGGVVQGYNDHRIVMAATVAALRCSDAVTICGAEAVRKSYPTFFEECEQRGMTVCRLFEETV